MVSSLIWSKGDIVEGGMFLGKKLTFKTLVPWIRVRGAWKRVQGTLRNRGFSSAQIKDIKDKFVLLHPKLDKWYEFVKIEYSALKGNCNVSISKKTVADIGESLEDLVQAALQSLGCTVESGSVHILNAPVPMKRDGAYKIKGFVFKRNARARDLVDFEGENVKIAIEVKNWDPSVRKNDDVVRKEIARRFRRVRKKDRYLLIPRNAKYGTFPFTSGQRQELFIRKRINEINLGEQLRWDNEKKVYMDVFSQIDQILSIH
jgi:hypothetical protein